MLCFLVLILQIRFEQVHDDDDDDDDFRAVDISYVVDTSAEMCEVKSVLLGCFR